MPRLSTLINRHQYPPVVHRCPRLLKLEFLLNRLLHSRTWIIRRELRRTLRQLPGAFTLLDAGCGSGQFLVPVARKHPDARFWGVDAGEISIRLLGKFLEATKTENVELIRGTLGKVPLPAADIICCFSVLSYLEDDLSVLKDFGAALREGGALLLYVPLVPRRVIPGYAKIRAEAYGEVDYDKVNKINNLYTEGTLSELLANAGFEITERAYSYGFAGRIAYEIITLVIYSIQRLHPAFALLLGLSYALFIHPPMLILMLIDFVIPKKSGNGLFLKAQKKNEKHGRRKNHILDGGSRKSGAPKPADS